MVDEKDKIENTKWLIQNKEKDLEDSIDSLKSIEQKASWLFGFIFLFYGTIFLEFIKIHIFYYEPLMTFLFLFTSLLSMFFLIILLWPKGVMAVVLFDKKDIFENDDLIELLKSYYDEIERCKILADSFVNQKIFNYKVSITFFVLSIILLILLIF